MNYKKIMKKNLKFIYKATRGMYRIFFANPLVWYKKRYCAAINEFGFYNVFEYKSDSFYPAIVKEQPKKTDKIYKRIVNFDEQGLPMVKGFVQKYWPVTIVQYGLLNYNFFLTYKDEKYKKLVIAVCDWLIENISDNGVWEHHIKYHSNVVNEDLLPPYASAMVQGEAISVLVRGYKITGNMVYLDCSEKALQPYTKIVSDGGVLDYFYDMPFYEEYPTNTPSLVLNGFMFSLFGLYDFSLEDHSGNELAKRLFNQGAETLIKVLPLYDGGFCSRYDLSYITCAPNNDNKNPFYHAIHVNQLMAMNSILHSDVIEYYVNAWK